MTGHPGNSPGRPVVAAEVKKLAKSYGREAIQRLFWLMNYAVDERTQKAAADSLLDRGFGKPVQQIEAGGPGAFENMEAEQLKEYVRRKALDMGKIIDVTPFGVSQQD